MLFFPGDSGSAVGAVPLPDHHGDRACEEGVGAAVGRARQEEEGRAVEPAPKVARWQNLIPSFPWIAPGWRACGGAIQGKEGSKFCSVAYWSHSPSSSKGQTHMI